MIYLNTLLLYKNYEFRFDIEIRALERKGSSERDYSAL